MSEITTFSNIQFNPICPDPATILLEDIAHALSLICRANGHFHTFYSVGQHSLNCMAEAEARGFDAKFQLVCLLHDASEAYLSDITRPVKQVLTQYQAVEQALQDQIWIKYLGAPLDDSLYRQMRQIDDALLYHEMLAFMGRSIYETPPQLSSVPSFSLADFSAVETQFLQHATRLLTAL